MRAEPRGLETRAVSSVLETGASFTGWLASVRSLT